MRRLGALLLLLGTTVAAAEGPVEVTARPAKSAVSVGERFLVEVVAQGPAGTTFTFPAAPGTEEVELRPVTGEEHAPPGTARYQAAVFTVQGASIPAISVRYRLPDGSEGEAASAPVPLELVSLLPREPAERTLADVRPPVAVPVANVFWVALAATLVLLSAAIVWLGRRAGRATEPVVEAPELAPDAEALAALDRLASSDLIVRGEFRLFYIALAEVAKRYLERRLGAPVLEMTSTEVIAWLRDRPEGLDVLATVRDVTGAADWVKFARGEGRAAAAERQLGAVRELIAAVERHVAARHVPAAEGA